MSVERLSELLKILVIYSSEGYQENVSFVIAKYAI